MLTYSKVQISNIAVKIASFLLLSTLAYQFKDYDLARGIVSSTNAVGIIMLFLAPILVRELSSGQNFLIKVQLFTPIFLAIFLAVGFWLDFSAGEWCLMFFLLLFGYRGVVDYLYIDQDQMLIRNWILFGISLIGTLLAFTSVDIFWIFSILLGAEIVCSLKLLSSESRNMRHEKSAPIYEILGYSLLLKFDVFVLLFLSQVVSQSATFLMLHASQLFSVIAVLRLHKWFEFMRNLTTKKIDECSVFMQNNAVVNLVVLFASCTYLLIYMYSIDSTGFIGSVPYTMFVLIVLYGYKFAFQETASVSNYMRYIMGGWALVASLSFVGLCLFSFYVDIWLGCVVASGALSLFVYVRSRLSLSS